MIKILKLQIEDWEKYLNCSRRTIYRMINRYELWWPNWLIHWLKWKPSNHQWSETKRGFVVDIYRNNKRLWDYSPTKLQEFIEDKYWERIPRETLRQIMIKEWFWQPKIKKRKVRHQRRNRKSKYGQLIQFDGSYHIWFENWIYWCLLVAIDDATSKIYAKFTKWEWLDDVLWFWELYIKKFGKPNAIYLDQHATYKVNNPWDQWDKEYRTRFERGMNRLWIEVIYAKTPEAKWRVERVNRTLQWWLVRKMRQKWIKTIEEWNKYLEEEYIQRHNKRFWIEAMEEWDIHTKGTKEEMSNFYWYFAKEENRVWWKDWVIRYKWREFQLPKSLQLQYRNVIVRETINNEIEILDGTIKLPFMERIHFTRREWLTKQLNN